jgi:CheY-like chemotaxis protein
MMADVVLVVEDETQVLILAESVLQQAGYETLSASSVAEALAIIDTDHRIGLLFTDLGLGEDEYMFSGAPPQRTFVGAVGTSVQCHLRTPTPHWLLRI